MWHDEWDKMYDKDKAIFAELTNLLLTSTFINREIIDPKDNIPIPNRDYRFIERYFSMFQDYLKVMNWNIHIDAQYGVITASNLNGIGLKRFDKSVTYFLLVLRLLYEEGREKLSLRKDIIICVADIIEKLVFFGLVDRKPADKVIQEAFVFLKKYALIDKLDGPWTEPDTRIVIYPSIMFIGNDNINTAFKTAQSITTTQENTDTKLELNFSEEEHVEE